MVDQFQWGVIKLQGSKGLDGLEHSFETMKDKVGRHSLSHQLLWDAFEEV